MSKAPRELRIPPQDIDIERALLGSIMLKPEGLSETIDIISPSSFYSEKHRIIYATMLDLFSRSEPVDLTSLSSRLKEKNQLDQIGGRSYLGEIVSGVTSSGNLKHYARVVQKKSTMRQLLEAADFINELGYDEASDIDETLDRAEKRIYEVTNAPSTHKFVEIRHTLGEAWERLERLNQSKEELRGIRTGFRDLDNLLAGLQKSDLVILAARPSMGKTALALDIARQAATRHKVPVGIFYLEMSAQQLVDRMLAAESRVDSWKLRTGKVTSE